MRKLLLFVLLPALGGATQPLPSFCERLAVDTGMKPVRGASPSAWQVNLLGGIGKALFGGQSVVAISQEPGELDEVARARFNKSCDATAKGAYCTIEAPNTMVLKLNGREVRQTAAPGERARVSVEKGRVRCEGASTD